MACPVDPQTAAEMAQCTGEVMAEVIDVILLVAPVSILIAILLKAYPIAKKVISQIG